MSAPRIVRSTVAATLVALAAVVGLVGCGRPAPPASEPAPPAFGLAGDRFYNAEAGYSVTIPPGWTLRPASDARMVMFDRDATTATFSLMALPGGAEVGRLVDATGANFEASGTSLGLERVERPIGSGPAAVAASGFVGRAASGDGRLVLRMLGADVPGRGGYVLVFEATPEADDLIAEERAAILDGFRPLDGVGAR